MRKPHVLLLVGVEHLGIDLRMKAPAAPKHDFTKAVLIDVGVPVAGARANRALTLSSTTRSATGN